MGLRFRYICGLAFFYHAVCFGQGNCFDLGDLATLEKMSPSDAVAQLIVDIKTAPSGGCRFVAGGHLIRYIRSLADKHQIDRVDDKTIGVIEALLDSDDVAAAMSLGAIGPRAKHALPRLKMLFEEASAYQAEYGVAGMDVAQLLDYAIRRIEFPKVENSPPQD